MLKVELSILLINRIECSVPVEHIESLRCLLVTTPSCAPVPAALTKAACSDKALNKLQHSLPPAAVGHQVLLHLCQHLQLVQPELLVPDLIQEASETEAKDADP